MIFKLKVKKIHKNISQNTFSITSFYGFEKGNFFHFFWMDDERNNQDNESILIQNLQTQISDNQKRIEELENIVEYLETTIKNAETNSKNSGLNFVFTWVPLIFLTIGYLFKVLNSGQV